MSETRSRPRSDDFCPAIVITPGRAACLLIFWFLLPLARAWAIRRQIPLWQAVLAFYGVYIGLGVVIILWWVWPRSDPVAEGLRRARRLLAIDPGMALVRGRGALEQALREAVRELPLPAAAQEPLGVYDLLLVIQPHLPEELFHEADHLRRLANIAAHDPDWSIDRREAKKALQVVAHIARLSRR